MKHTVQAIALIFVLCAFLSGCSLFEDDGPGSLEGTWFNEAPFETADQRSLTQRFEITFKDNQTFEGVTVVVKSSTGELLGYRFAEEGRYLLKGNQLTLTPLRRASHDDTGGLYSPREALVTVEVQEETTTIKVEVAADVMTWKFPPCPPNANCIDSLRFRRKSG